MDETQFQDTLISLFPSFEPYWSKEDINRENDGSYTAHGLLSTFFFFYKEQYRNIEEEIVRRFAVIIEQIVTADPNDESEVANAICTSFLELIDEEREGKFLEAHLGIECSRFLEAMRGNGS